MDLEKMDLNKADLPLPSWLDKLRPHPDYANRVYSETAPALRARLKTAIAWRFSLEAQAPYFAARESIGAERAFLSKVSEQAADLTLIFLDSAQQAPARLLAAVIPAVLAGVRDIWVIVLGGPPSPGNCLALELAGVENIFALSDADLPALADWLAKLPDSSACRYLFFGCENIFSTIMDQAGARQITASIWREIPPRDICISPDSSESFRQILKWAHGPGLELTEAKMDTELTCPAFFSERNFTSRPKNCPQAYGPGLEACWRHPDLGTSFFRHLTIQACLAN